jgi:hypothetical protein
MSNFVLNKGQINNVVLTLSERSQITSPWFLIVFENKFSVDGETAKCSMQNGVAPNNRYDLLVIKEKTSPDPLQGEVFLIAGEWSYKVYESAGQTLNVADTTGRILQQGLLIVK